MGWARDAATTWLLIALSAGCALAEAAPEPDSYRTESYRAPVPITLKGATVVSTEQVIALWRDKAALFIDVLPHDQKPANLPAGTIWREKRRENIPGSIWLANVGYGVLNAEMESYFRDSLRKLLGDDKDARVLFYCMENCWMSWNAARRAVSWGYHSVLWYPLGTDGWIAAGQPTMEAKPYQLPIARP